MGRAVCRHGVHGLSRSWQPLFGVLSIVVVAGCGGSGGGGGHRGPDWAHVRSVAAPQIVASAEFDTPRPQPLATDAWEDGVYISRDGLHLYAFYAPADMFVYSDFAAAHPGCVDIAPFLRRPQLGIDLVTNPWGCAQVLHSDIAIAERVTATADFSGWGLSNLRQPARFEGGFVALDNPDGTIDAVFSLDTDTALGDLYWARGVSHNPPASAFQPMPSPINDAGQQDNPHLERLGPSTLVLLFDNDGVGDPSVEIRYSLSTDDGQSWSPPAPLGSPINDATNDMTAHLWYDGNDWWLYFASDRTGLLSIHRARHNDSAHIATDFDDWGAVELVVAPGTVPDGSARIVGVGEPSLTRRGDLSFAVVYEALEGATSHDRFDIDPWFAPHR